MYRSDASPIDDGSGAQSIAQMGEVD